MHAEASNATSSFRIGYSLQLPWQCTSMGTPIRVLTLNTWGLWLVSRDREARMLHLAQYLQVAKDLVGSYAPAQP